MPISPEEKHLLDLIAKYNFLDQCNATGLLDRYTFDKLVFLMDADSMDKIQYYLKRLNEHHEDTRAFLDKAKENSNNSATCDHCNSDIQDGEVHLHHGMVLCEDCYIDKNMIPKRKTHWQYLRFIQTEYLRPGKLD